MRHQVDANHYYLQAYDTKGRFLSYWHQIDELNSLNAEMALEVGIGNGFVSRYLRERNKKIITLDLCIELSPNLVGSILDLPFKDSAFPVVMCCQVLEHIPYENFVDCLSELSRITDDHIILSLPDTSPSYKFFIEIPKIRQIKTIISHPLPRLSDHEFTGQHYWEIGKSQYPLKRIKEDITKCNLAIKKTYRIYEYRYHRFFLLSKS